MGFIFGGIFINLFIFIELIQNARLVIVINKKELFKNYTEEKENEAETGSILLNNEKRWRTMGGIGESLPISSL